MNDETKVIIGDNPFFGVNHKVGAKPLDEERERFSQAIEILKLASDHGCNRFMVTNHLGLQTLLNLIDANGLQKIKLAFIIPYPHKYNDIVARGGYWALLRYLLKGNLWYLVKNIISLPSLRHSQENIVRMIVNAELASISKHVSKVEHVCLHNILVDMYVASGNSKVLEVFIEYVNSIGIKPVLITQNVEALCSTLRIKEGYTVCFSYNPLGYMTNPSLASVDKFLAQSKTARPQFWAMQIMASGAASLGAALEKTLKNKSIDGILYATAKKERVTEFFNKFKKYKA